MPRPQATLENGRKLPRSSFLPYPELVEFQHSDGGWSVVDSNDHPELPSNGVTNQVLKQIFVPLEEGGTGVTLHELAHVKWSPLRFPRVRHPLIVLQAVEDARINLGLAYLGMPVTLDRESIAKIAHTAAREAKTGQIAAGILRGVASLGTEAEGAMRRELDALPKFAARLARYWIDQVEVRLVRSRERMGPGTPVAPFRVARRLARDLARDLERQGLLSEDTPVVGVGCCVSECSAAHGGAERDFGFPGDDPERYERWMRHRRLRPSYQSELEVGHMTISRPPLTVRQPSSLRRGLGPRRAATEGAHIIRPDRLVLDGAIFGRRARDGGGTVLIDTSGSMSLSVRQVEEIVRAAGGHATVAIYSGEEDRGELRIVAEGDWRASNEQFEPYGMGNIVDLPALRWLAKMPEPRWIITDMGFTGINDESSASVDQACIYEIERGRIRQAYNVAAFLKLAC